MVRRSNSDPTDALIAGCGIIGLTLGFVVILDVVLAMLAYKAAGYFGYPGYLGVLAVLLVNLLFGALRGRK